MKGAVLAICLSLISACGLFGEEPVTQRLLLSEAMTPREWRETGMKKLTAAQRAAFEQWLTEWSRRLLISARQEAEPETVEPMAPAPSISRGNLASDYPALGEHQMGQNCSRSRAGVLILDDGSIWQVASTDRVTCALWSFGGIRVAESNAPIAEYRYWLINDEEGERVLARYLGR